MRITFKEKREISMEMINNPMKKEEIMIIMRTNNKKMRA